MSNMKQALMENKENTSPEVFEGIIALPRLDTKRMAETFKTAAHSMDKVEKARQIIEQAEKENSNHLIF